MDLDQFRKIYSDYRLAESKTKANQYRAWDYSSEHYSMRAPFDKRQFDPRKDKAEELYTKESKFVQMESPPTVLSHLRPGIVGGLTSKLSGQDFRDTSAKFATYGELFNHLPMVPDVVNIVKQMLTPLQTQMFVESINSINANANSPGLLLSTTLLTFVKKMIASLLSTSDSLENNDRRVFKDSLNKIEMLSKDQAYRTLPSKAAELLARLADHVLTLNMAKRDSFDRAAVPDVRQNGALQAEDTMLQNQLNEQNSTNPQSQLAIIVAGRDLDRLEGLTEQDYNQGVSLLLGVYSDLLEQVTTTTEAPMPLRSQATSIAKGSEVKTVNTDTKYGEKKKEPESLVELLKKILEKDQAKKPGGDDDEEDDDEGDTSPQIQDPAQTPAPQAPAPQAPAPQAPAPQAPVPQAPVPQLQPVPPRTTPQGPTLIVPNNPTMVPTQPTPADQVPIVETQAPVEAQAAPAEAQAPAETQDATMDAQEAQTTTTQTVTTEAAPTAAAETLPTQPAAPVQEAITSQQAQVSPTNTAPPPVADINIQTGVVIPREVVKKSWPEQFADLEKFTDVAVTNSDLFNETFKELTTENGGNASIFYMNPTKRKRMYKLLKFLKIRSPLKFTRDYLRKDTPEDILKLVAPLWEEGKSPSSSPAALSSTSTETGVVPAITQSSTSTMEPVQPQRWLGRDEAGRLLSAAGKRGRGRPKKRKLDESEDSVESKKARVQLPSSLSSMASPAQVSTSPDILDLHKDDLVTSITVKRSPLPQFMEDLFESLSNGTWSQLKKKHGFDSFFHLAAVINDDILIEKNSNGINVAIYKPYESEEIVVPSKLLGKFTLGQMVENVKKDMGQDFYSYHPFENNCQNFMFRFLKDSKALTPQIAEFVSQPIENLVKDLPAHFPGMVKTAADIYGVVQPLLNP